MTAYVARSFGFVRVGDFEQLLNDDDLTELRAADSHCPVDHVEKMVGFIAWMIARYLKLDKGNRQALVDKCMPWESGE